jgi:hypothetical protein
MVELALMTPVLALMLILIFDFTRILYHSLILTNAARDGAWVATDPGASNDTICARVVASVPTGYAACATSDINPTSGRTFNQGLPVVVKATYQFSPITPGLKEILTNLGVISGGTFKLEQSVLMVIL